MEWEKPRFVVIEMSLHPADFADDTRDSVQETDEYDIIAPDPRRADASAD